MRFHFFFKLKEIMEKERALLTGCIKSETRDDEMYILLDFKLKEKTQFFKMWPLEHAVWIINHYTQTLK